MTSKYFDIHCHTNFVAFDSDRDEIISRALHDDTWLINVGTQYDTSKKAVEIADMYKDGVYATIGLHPIHTSSSYHDKEELGEDGKEFISRGEIFDKEKYKELAKNKKVIAIGECGLDYYRILGESIEKQKQAFIAQIELADELNLPLMLHIRNNDESLESNAYQDAISLIKKYSKNKRGVVHFFAGSLRDAEDFINLGFYLSFTGVITYLPRKDGKCCNYSEIIKNIPIERIMADTDSPYVAPIPHRGERNEPSNIKYIIKKIAQIKELDEDIVSETVVSNIKNLFNISK